MRQPQSTDAISCALGRWPAMLRYCDDGLLEIDNNIVNAAGGICGVVIEWGATFPQKQRQRAPVAQEIGDGFAQARVRFGLVLRQLCFQPLMQLVHNGLAAMLMEP